MPGLQTNVSHVKRFQVMTGLSPDLNFLCSNLHFLVEGLPTVLVLHRGVACGRGLQRRCRQEKNRAMGYTEGIAKGKATCRWTPSDELSAHWRSHLGSLLTIPEGLVPW